MDLSKENRLALHRMLSDTLGSEHCYFQPPESVKLRYPCIVYHYDNNTRIYADNAPYFVIHQYIVTLITRDPEDPVVDKLTKIPRMRFDRYYTSDNLHHYAFVYVMTTKEIDND